MKPFKVIRLPRALREQEATVILDELDRGCSELLELEEYSAALILPESLKVGIKALLWLDDLKDRFGLKKKKFCIITSDKKQLEAIELSHPDQSLSCFTSIEELCKKLNVDVQDDFSDIRIDGIPQGAEEEKKEIGPVMVSAGPLTEIEKTEDILSKGPLIDGGESTLSVSGAVPEQIIRTVGERVETTGEYCCCSCGNHRMWMKGDTFSVCEQDFCPQRDEGWQLTFILF
jgi:hypothetical protein